MRRLIATMSALACLAGNAPGLAPLIYEGKVDLQSKPMDQGGKPSWTLGVKVGNTGRVRLYTYEGTNVFNPSAYTVTFHAGPDRSRAGLVEVAATSASTYVEWTFGSNDLAYAFGVEEPWYSAVRFAQGSVIVSQPEGLLSCSGAPEIDGGDQDFTYVRDWALWTFLNTASYGPYTFVGATTTTNSRGQISVTFSGAGDAVLSANQTFTGTNTFTQSIFGTATNATALGGVAAADYATDAEVAATSAADRAYADGIVEAHTNAADPHTGYLLASGDTMTGPLNGGGQVTTNWLSIRARIADGSHVYLGANNRSGAWEESKPSIGFYDPVGTTYAFITYHWGDLAFYFDGKQIMGVGDPSGASAADMLFDQGYGDARYWQHGESVTNVAGSGAALTGIPTNAMTPEADALYANTVDASGFSGNLTAATTNLQALADAVDVLEAGSGTSTADVQIIAFDQAITPHALASGDPTTTVARIYGTNVYQWTLTNNSVLSFNADDWPTTQVGRVTIELIRGAFSPAFDTTIITNSDLLDLTATNTTIPLFFRKPVSRTMWRVGQ